MHDARKNRFDDAGFAAVTARDPRVVCSSMDYDEWEAGVPAEMRQDVLWRVQAYRLANYLSACAEVDTRGLVGDLRFSHHITQLCRATASVPANIAEGYVKRSAKDRARYYEYALASLAEAKVWYLSVRSTIDGGAMNERLALMRSITRLLLTMLRHARARDQNVSTRT
jgi:four helix bundle protein